MAVPSLNRKLLAILAADMVGYSKAMEADEAGTITRLRTIRAELTDPIIARHHGRIVKLMGDEVEPRRQFIEDNALNVRNLDV